jgi:hypothetical protein
MNRRDLLKSLAVGAAAGSLPAAMLSQPALAAQAAATPPRGPWWLLSPYVPGQHVAFGWHLGLLEASERGAVILNLHQDNGDDARVHICYHDGDPRGIGHSELLDLVLMDGGDGSADTEESLGRVVRHLGNVIARNELRPDAERELARLMTHGERVEAFGPETLL